MEKSTTENTIHMFQSLIKSDDDQYIAILSDDSVDRQGEIVGLKALEKIRDDEGFIVALIDHENKVMNQVAEWTNRQIQQIDGRNALTATPKWFLSNPNAVAIKGMLDDGARVGVSIGAIVKDTEEKTIDGKKTVVYTDVELLEASFVGIPANRHAAAMAIVKSLNIKEEKKMEQSYTQKDIDEATVGLQKTIDSLKKELEEVKPAEPEAKPEEEAKEEAKEETKEEEKPAEEKEEEPAEKPKEDATAEENKKLKEELQTMKEASLLKGTHETVEGTDNKIVLEKGKLPILRV